MDDVVLQHMERPYYAVTMELPDCLCAQSFRGSEHDVRLLQWVPWSASDRNICPRVLTNKTPPLVPLNTRGQAEVIPLGYVSIAHLWWLPSLHQS